MAVVLRLDEERRRLFRAVRARLKPEGYYLVSTAVMDPEHETRIGPASVVDPATGVVYREYGGGLLVDLHTGIVLRPFEDPVGEYPDGVTIAGRRYLPHRRHLRPAALTAELEAAGFEVFCRYPGHAGRVACRLHRRRTPSREWPTRRLLCAPRP
ncbi:MAG: hypothetical protein AB1505_15660, partial [Candidatus Latescibacterota bacterium]